jgi:hypothetical protein
MFDINELNMCIKASWLGRWRRSFEHKDYYGLVLAPDREEKAEKINSERVGVEGGAVLGDIVLNWERYKKAYYKEGNAILEAVVRDNRTLGREGKSLWELVFGMRRYGVMAENIGEAKLNVVVGEDGYLRDKVYIEGVWGVQIQWAEYLE